MPAKTNPLGVKGCGEAGCAGALTSVMNAVVDALSELRHPPHRHAGHPIAIRDARASGSNDDAGRRSPSSTRARRTRELVAGVCAAHLVSHYYMVLLAPLFVFIRRTTASAIPSSASRSPPSTWCRRCCRRRSASSSIASGAHQSDRRVAAGLGGGRGRGARRFVLGVHRDVRRHGPRQHGLPSGRLRAAVRARIATARITQVFSFHTCAGMIGSAIAPVTLLFMQSMVGWRGAFVRAGVLGIVAALILALQGEPPAVAPPPPKPRATTATARRGRLAAAAVAADPAQPRVLRGAVDGRRRPQQYLVVGLESAARHAGGRPIPRSPACSP